MRSSKSFSQILESTDCKITEAYGRLRSEGDLVKTDEVVKEILAAGFSRADARLAGIFAALDKNDFLTLTRFREIVSENELVEKIFKNDLPISDFAKFAALLQEIYRSIIPDNSGHVATYIPPLAKADPACLGISFCSVLGQRLDIGQSAGVKFSVQSVSKPVTYALAVAEHGSDRVHQGVGFEPSGRHFNERLLKQPEQIPHNPLINAGSIYCSALLEKDTSSWERVEKILGTWRSLTEETDAPYIDTAVFLSEQATANRNNCLAYMMAEQGLITDVHTALTTYFQSCSITSNARSLALLTATLANSGVHPITNTHVFPARVTAQMLTLMLTCGLYDGSGEFLVRCGFPAKSGVSGAVVGVLPGIGGFCVYSPRLDASGNSVRGIKFCEELARRLPCVHSFASFTPRSGLQPGLIRDLFAWRTAADRNSLQTVTLRELASLWWSAAWGCQRRIRQLAARGMDVNGTDYDGRSALHIAASNGYVSVFNLLVALGADRSLRDRRGRTPDELRSSTAFVHGTPCAGVPVVEASPGAFSLRRYFAGEDESGLSAERVLAELRSCGVAELPSLEKEVVRLLRSGEVGESATLSSQDSVVVKALCGKMQVPNWPRFVSRLETLKRGHPEIECVCLRTCTQQQLRLVEDHERPEAPFPVGGLIRPVLYCAAVELCGLTEVHRWVGKEPSGESEDTLSLLNNKLPYNPFVLAGVLALCGLILQRCDHDVGKAEAAVKTLWRRLAGPVAQLAADTAADAAAAEGELRKARIRCVAYMLQAERRLPGGEGGELVEKVVSLCERLHDFRVSASAVTAVGATLARGGEEAPLPEETARQTLSLLFSCGADQLSGEWAFKMGVPAKLDLAHGRALVVVPKVMGVFIAGKSSAAVLNFMAAMEQAFTLHMFKRHDLVTGSGEPADPALYFGSVKHELVSKLLLTAAKGDLQTLRTTLAIPGVDCNWQDYDGRTALHLAAAHGHAEIVDLLLALGAQSDVRDRWGVTPLDEARDEDQELVVQRLQV